MRGLKSLFVVLASAGLMTPLVAAGHAEQVSDDVNMDEIRVAIEQLETPIERFDQAIQMGATPDENGVIEFDEPIDYQMVDGEFYPTTGIINPDYVDGDSDFVSDAPSTGSSQGEVALRSIITCTDNPGYVWVSNSRSNVCWAYDGGETSPYPVDRICTNLYGGYEAGTFYYNNAGAARQSPWRGGVGCWDFTSTVSAYGVTYRIT